MTEDEVVRAVTHRLLGEFQIGDRVEIVFYIDEPRFGVVVELQRHPVAGQICIVKSEDGRRDDSWHHSWLRLA